MHRTTEFIKQADAGAGVGAGAGAGAGAGTGAGRISVELVVFLSAQLS